MRVLEDSADFFVGRISFPLLNHLLNRKHVLSCYRELLLSERLPEERLRELQFEKLIRVLRHAGRWCSFYRERFRALGFVPEDVRTLEDLKRLPPLGRKDVIEHRAELVDERDREAAQAADEAHRAPGMPLMFGNWRRNKLVRNTSSGSTGAPVVFYEDGTVTARNWAFELRFKAWFGMRPGVREARMARVSADYLPNSFQNRARKQLWHQLILPGVNLSDVEYQLCVDKLKAFRPKVLWGYTSSLTGMAEYIRRCRIDPAPFRPELLISWAAPLYEHEDKLLREVFACAVTNIYGTREVGHIAALCPAGSRHINQEHFLIERDESGELLATQLDPAPMPFIRYRLGDLGEPAVSQCSCGRNLQVINNFLGRTGEIFVTKNGRMISPNFWCRFFMIDDQSQSVARFQVVYLSNQQVRLRIVKSPSFSEHTEADMRRTLARNFSSDIRFEFEYVPSIEAQVSGKYQMVVNAVKS